LGSYVGTESNFPLAKFVTLGVDCIDGNSLGRFDNADGITGFTSDISEPGESEDGFVAVAVGVGEVVAVGDGSVADGVGKRGGVAVGDGFVADGVGKRGGVAVEDSIGVADGLGNCPALQPENHMPRTKMKMMIIHAFVFIFLCSSVPSRPTVWLTCRRDWQDDKIMITRKTGKWPPRTAPKAIGFTRLLGGITQLYDSHLYS
jgi:hypothetical protein